MPLSDSILAFPDIKDALERALATENGIKFSLPTAKDAFRFVARCNHYRVLDRRQNRLLYPEGNTMHGCSIYDRLYIRHQKGAKEVRIEILKPLEIAVEEI